MAIVKTHRYAVSVHVSGAGFVRMAAAGKPAVRVAVPPEFRGGEPGAWSPEELLVGSVASCFALTLEAVAAHRHVPLLEVEVRAAGHVDRRDGRYRYVFIEVDAEIETEPEHVADAEEAARLANELCLVGAALEIPVQYRIDVGARSREEALAR